MILIIAMMKGLVSGKKVIKKRKAQKALIKEELIPVTWHPSRWWDWCVHEDDKKDAEKLWQ